GVIPAGFAPISTTFVSTTHGWFLGAGKCGGVACRALLVTRDAGRTFTAVSVPPTAVGQVRFANGSDGWAYGDATGGAQGLWRTDDGARHWHRVDARPVQSLAVDGPTVWVVVFTSTGSGAELDVGSVANDRLVLVTEVARRGGYVTAAQGSAFVDGVLGQGPYPGGLTVVDHSGVHQRSAPPCPGGDNLGTSEFELAPVDAPHLVAVCWGQPAAGTQRKSAFTSDDAGNNWTRRPDPPVDGYTGHFLEGSIAATSRATFISGGRSAVLRKIGNGPWRAVLDDGGTGDGFIYVGMTDDLHGVALNAQGAWLTADGGDTWRKLRF
ncbi:MAG: hypothetical protein M3O32_20330, partial [Actinomycetota bacterium]|nr:hypothetical protein [Actinomycetota bacterium]